MAPEDLVWVVVIAVVMAAACVPWAGWELAHALSGAPAPPGAGPAALAEVAKGRTTWPAAATWWTAALATVVAGAGATVAWRRSGTHAVERAGRYLPRDRGMRRYTTGTGPRIGHLTRGRAELRMTTEDQAVIVAGPRTGKTTRLAVPAALAARGPVLVTSNKRDVYDAIAGPRAKAGRVWLFDPQGLAGGEPTWWWDPLSIAGDVRGARRLASIWAQATRPADAKADAYFDPEGQELLAALLLAASSSGQRLSAVYGWLARPSDPAPALALDTAGHDLMAAGLRARQELPDKQRAGVYGTAAKIVAWLADPAVRRWVEPADTDAEAFDAAAFVVSTATLVSLSREGEGSSAPLVTALTAAVLEAAERVAAASPGGRLAVELVGVLDEAANVCRWRELPDLYSHYGSRGIVLLSFFQSWAQVVEGFGAEGAEKLWGAANVRVYAGGVSDTRWLTRLSELCGEVDEVVWSRSTSRHGPSRTRSTQRRRVLPVDRLASWPAGLALVLLSGTSPAVVRLTPWWEDKRG